MMGWTGVQYSALRVAASLCVLAACLRRLPFSEGLATPLLLLSIPLAALLLIGWRDREIAPLLIGTLVGGAGLAADSPLPLPERDVLFTSVMLALHAMTPAAPFGSLEARDRVDPRGGWDRPARVGGLAWLVLALTHSLRAYSLAFGNEIRLEDALWPSGLAFLVVALDVFFLAATGSRPLRAPAWIAAFTMEAALAVLPSAPVGSSAFLLLHLFAAEPAWWPGRPLARHGRPATSPDEPARLYYDGDCGFCHRAVRIVLSEDANTPAAFALRFAPLAGPTFERQVATRSDVRTEALPDSIVLVLEDGRLLTRSTAAVEIASRLGGLWRAVALIGDALPSRLLDAVYDAIARVRSKLFAQPKDACPILPPELRQRFDP
jgi:predicted DCC family thiol-disulfide oxidoreductase YuxK